MILICSHYVPILEVVKGSFLPDEEASMHG